MDAEPLLRRANAAYNARDLDTLTAMLSDDVDWPDGEGGRLHGRDAVRAYWAEQWTRLRTHDEPVGFEATGDGRTAVHLHQVVRDPDGSVLSTASAKSTAVSFATVTSSGPSVSMHPSAGSSSIAPTDASATTTTAANPTRVAATPIGSC